MEPINSPSLRRKGLEIIFPIYVQILADRSSTGLLEPPWWLFMSVLVTRVLMPAFHSTPPYTLAYIFWILVLKNKKRECEKKVALEELWAPKENTENTNNV